MIYGYLVEWFSEDGKRFAIDESNQFDNEDNSLNVFEVIPETIGQFIGQLDVNNVEIYEHDIVEFEYFSSQSLKTGVVKWSNETSSFYIECERIVVWFDKETVKKLKVIGNTLKDSKK